MKNLLRFFKRRNIRKWLIIFTLSLFFNLLIAVIYFQFRSTSDENSSRETLFTNNDVIEDLEYKYTKKKGVKFVLNDIDSDCEDLVNSVVPRECIVSLSNIVGVADYRNMKKVVRERIAEKLSSGSCGSANNSIKIGSKCWFRSDEGHVRRRGTESVDVSKYEVIVVGTGIMGSVLADLHGRVLGKRVLVIEKESFVGGKIRDVMDEKGFISGAGKFVFHTDSEEIWKYVNQFAEFDEFEVRVFTDYEGLYLPFPPTIDAINRLHPGVSMIHTREEMEDWYKKKGDADVEGRGPTNIAGFLKKNYGSEIYTKFYEGHFWKKWGSDPENLIVDYLLKDEVDLLPRMNRDNRYYRKRFQGIPKEGYTKMIRKMLNHPNIDVLLNLNFDSIREEILSIGSKVYFTGGIDEYFGYEHGALEYNSVDLVKVDIEALKYFSPNEITDFMSKEVPYSRLFDLSSFPSYFRKSQDSVSVIALSIRQDNNGVMKFLPMRNEKNMERFRQYTQLSSKNNRLTLTQKNLEFVDMDRSIQNAFELFRENNPLKETTDIFKVNFVVEKKKPTVTLVSTHCKELTGNKMKRKQRGLESFLDELYFPLSEDFDVLFYINSKCGFENDVIVRELEKRNVTYILELQQNKGREEFGHLAFMLFQPELHGDYNIFLQAHLKFKSPCVVKQIQAMRNDIEAIQEQRNPEFRNEVDYRHDGKHNSYFNGFFPMFHTVKKRKNMWVGDIEAIGAQDYMYRFVSDFWEKKKKSEFLHKDNYLCYTYQSSAEFYATKDLLHQLQARHMNTLEEIYYRAWKDRNRNPFMMEMIWGSLLKGFPLSHTREIREDMAYSSCKCENIYDRLLCHKWYPEREYRKTGFYGFPECTIDRIKKLYGID